MPGQIEETTEKPRAQVRPGIHCDRNSRGEPLAYLCTGAAALFGIDITRHGDDPYRRGLTNPPQVHSAISPARGLARMQPGRDSDPVWPPAAGAISAHNHRGV
jgi:hypothetical protein